MYKKLNATEKTDRAKNVQGLRAIKLLSKSIKCLKDKPGALFIWVWGHAKVMSDFIFGILALTPLK
jgi:hypothetical protein